MLRRLGRGSGFILLLVMTGLGCGLLPSPRETPAEPPATHATTPGGPAVIPSPQQYSTPTGVEEVPGGELPTGQGLTWLASGIYPVGEPQDGWQTYRAAVAYENRTGQFTNELPSCELWSPEVATEEG